MRILFLFFCITCLAASGQTVVIDHAKVGDVAANAKAFDCDAFFPFNAGAAVVRKGQLTGLIDADLHILVPYGRYSLDGADAADGMFRVPLAEHRQLGLVNNRGKLIYAGEIPYEFSFGHDGFYWIVSYARQNGKTAGFDYMFIDAVGRTLAFKNWRNPAMFKSWSEGRGRFLSGLYYGFADAQGKIVIPAQYEEAKDFSEGLAAVAKRDAFGEIKWGFIDHSGTVVIPFRYSLEPSSFGNGLAVVKPKNAAEVKFSLINKKGEAVVNVPPGSQVDVETRNKFSNGLLFNNEFGGIDTAANPFRSENLFQRCGIPKISGTYNPYRLLHGQGNAFFQFERATNDGTKQGLLDLNAGTYIDAVFDALGFFDTVTNLAYAKLRTGYENVTGKPIYREGYIDRTGQFVIVRAQAASNW